MDVGGPISPLPFVIQRRGKPAAPRGFAQASVQTKWSRSEQCTLYGGILCFAAQVLLPCC